MVFVLVPLFAAMVTFLGINAGLSAVLRPSFLPAHLVVVFGADGDVQYRLLRLVPIGGLFLVFRALDFFILSHEVTIEVEEVIKVQALVPRCRVGASYRRR